MRRFLIAAALCALATAAAGNGDPFAFLPDGGRGIFSRAFPDRPAQQAALATTRSEAEWTAALTGAALTPREVETLAAYLARIAPWTRGPTPLPDFPPTDATWRWRSASPAIRCSRDT